MRLFVSDRERAFRELTKNGEKNTTCLWFGPHPVFAVNKAETIQASFYYEIWITFIISSIL